MGKYFIININSNISSFYLFMDTTWISTNHARGVGFVLINSQKKSILTCHNRIEASSSLEAELSALEKRLKVA